MLQWHDMSEYPKGRDWFIIKTDKSPTGGVIVRNVTGHYASGKPLANPVFRDRAGDAYTLKDCEGWRPIRAQSQSTPPSWPNISTPAKNIASSTNAATIR